MADTDLVTLAELHVQQRRATPLAHAWGDEQDATLIEAATAAIETHCRRAFVRRTITEDHGLDGGLRVTRRGYWGLDLRRWPVQSVSAVTIYDDEEDPDGDELESDDWWLSEPATGRLMLLEWGFSWLGGWDGRVRVTYSAGDYPGTADVPLDLKQACIAVVARLRDAPADDPDIAGIASLARYARPLEVV